MVNRGGKVGEVELGGRVAGGREGEVGLLASGIEECGGGAERGGGRVGAEGRHAEAADVVGRSGAAQVGGADRGGLHKQKKD